MMMAERHQELRERAGIQSALYAGGVTGGFIASATILHITGRSLIAVQLGAWTHLYLALTKLANAIGKDQMLKCVVQDWPVCYLAQ